MEQCIILLNQNSYTVKAGFNKVRYKEMLDIAKQIFGPSRNPFLYHTHTKNIVRYIEVGYNVMSLLVQPFFCLS